MHTCSVIMRCHAVGQMYTIMTVIIMHHAHTGVLLAIRCINLLTFPAAVQM